MKIHSSREFEYGQMVECFTMRTSNRDLYVTGAMTPLAPVTHAQLLADKIILKQLIYKIYWYL
jgi:hypothetical protein